MVVQTNRPVVTYVPASKILNVICFHLTSLFHRSNFFYERGANAPRSFFNYKDKPESQSRSTTSCFAELPLIVDRSIARVVKLVNKPQDPVASDKSVAFPHGVAEAGQTFI